jgi:hypothetical protein
MESKGIRKFYDPSPTPILYLIPISNVLGRVPLMPLFLHCNSIPHGATPASSPPTQQIPKRLRSCFQRVGTNESGRKGSNVYDSKITS